MFHHPSASFFQPLPPASLSLLHVPPSISLPRPASLPPASFLRPASFMSHHPASFCQAHFLYGFHHPASLPPSSVLHPPSSSLLHPASLFQPPSSSLPLASSPPPPGRIAEMTFPDVPRGHFLGTAPPNDPLLDTFPDTFPGRSPRFPGGSREVPLRSFAGPCTYH